MPFGYLLNRLRVEKGLSLRKLGELSGVDHTYLNRLEVREKDCPSEELVEKLVRALELGDRDAWLLGYVARFREYVDVGMIEYVFEHPKIKPEEFSWAVSLRFRRPGLGYPVLFACAREIIKTVDDFMRGKFKSAAALGHHSS